MVQHMRMGGEFNQAIAKLTTKPILTHVSTVTDRPMQAEQASILSTPECQTSRNLSSQKKRSFLLF